MRGLAAALLRPGGDEDAWGFDPRLVAAVRPALGLLHDRWWRVTTTGTEHVPAQGPALVVANHGGVLPWDAAMIATALERAGRRSPRFLAHDRAFELPWLSTYLRRFGGVPASAHNALGLLGDGHVVVTFPEGSRGLGKPWGERYRLQSFGRGGFVELALRAQVPIVPCAVVGSEETHPKVGEAPGLARLLGAPYAPITPTLPWLGPLGAIGLPARWRIDFRPPPDLGGGPEVADDRQAVLERSDRVRDIIQRALWENLILRQGTFR